MRSWVRGTIALITLLVLPACKITPTPKSGSEPAPPSPAPPADQPAPSAAEPPAVLPIPALPATPAPSAVPSGIPMLAVGELPALPATTAEERRASVDAKLTTIRAWLAATGRRGLLLGRPAAYAWLTGGVSNELGLDAPPATLVVLPDRALVAASSAALEAARSGLRGLGFQAVSVRWDRALDPGGVVEAVRTVAGSGALAADLHLPGTEYVGPEAETWRLTLTRTERLRLGWLAATAAEVVGRVAGATQPTTTEAGLERKLSDSLRAAGVEPRDVRVTALARLAVDGLVHGGGRTLAEGAAIHATVARWGLLATVGRSVTPTEESAATDDYVTARRLEAGVLGALRPAATLREVYLAALTAARENGRQELFERRSPGGLGAFELAARPFASAAVEAVAPQQAATVTVRLPRGYVADTVLVGVGELRLLTVTPGWPSPGMVVNGRVVPLPTLRGGELAVARAESERAAALARTEALRFLQNLVGTAAGEALKEAKRPAPAAAASVPTDEADEPPRPAAGARAPSR